MTAEKANDQRKRIELRAKPLRFLGARTCVLYGGRGTFLRLASHLAPLVGQEALYIGSPVETVDLVLTRAMGVPPRIIIIAPHREAQPILDEVERRARERSWPDPVDLLVGLRSRDREAFLRQAIKAARARVAQP